MRNVVMLSWVVMVACAGPAAPRGGEAFEAKSWVVSHAQGEDVLAQGTAVRQLPVRAVLPKELSPEAPVLVFMHGTSSEQDAHQLLAEDLASQGWVVVLAAYPGLARTVEVAGTAARPASPKLLAALAKLVEPAGATVAAEPFFQQSLALFREDVRLVTESTAAQLGLSMKRIVYGGHSFGAMVTMEVCRTDPRCVAFINLDGPPVDLDGERFEPKPVDRPMLVITSELMVTGAKTRALWDLLRVQDERGKAPLLSVQLVKAGHLDLTDAPVALGHVLQGLLFGEGAAGSIHPVRAVDVTRTVVSRFLQRYGVCDASVELPGELASIPELSPRATRALDQPCR